MKNRTVKALKWNVVDRVATQVMYAVTGVVLARELSQEAFGLVGALMVFQSFAMLFIDSGFSFALIQRKRPDEVDYSSVFWFNMIVASLLYVVLFLCAPFIADLFGGDERLIPLGRVMFFSLIINSLGIVQVNRLMKQMNVRPIAAANFVSLAAGGGVGIWMAFNGYGAWSMVWQTMVLNVVKVGWLWWYCRWRPMMRMSRESLRSFFRVGSAMAATSFLNVVFQNIYSFFIGNRAGLVPLGYYSQADKWSKMGVTSVTQVVTSAFLPTLSEVQDDGERFRRIAMKIDRLTSLAAIPAVVALVIMASGIFHVLFGTKWDASVVLFQLLLFRGIFTVFNTQHNNFMLALGRSRPIFWLEVMRDVVAVAGIVAVLPWIAVSTVDNAVYGLTLLLWGQVAASALTWVVTIVVSSRVTMVPVRMWLGNLLPGVLLGGCCCLAMMVVRMFGMDELAELVVEGVVVAVIVLGVLRRYSRR